jgi:hypothetical protein
MSDNQMYVADLEFQMILSFFEQCLVASAGCLALAAFCGVGVVIGVLPLVSAAMLFGAAMQCFLIGLCVTAVQWYLWRARWRRER